MIAARSGSRPVARKFTVAKYRKQSGSQTAVLLQSCGYFGEESRNRVCCVHSANVSVHAPH